MDLVINSKRVFTHVTEYTGTSIPSKDNNTFSWSLNALVRYWNHPQPTMFRYNQQMDKPITEEEKKRWGI